ncbi:MAG: cell division protein ZapD [Gammaproteobacteria bacterium]|nr:cell division protein ZapD [Gammaproteobacteria bacterium]
MLIVGLTGGIGSGKSAVTRRFEILGVPVVDTDIIAREVVEPGSPALEEIASYFGEEILTDEGGLNRPLLRKRIFQSNRDRKWLESLLHPLIRRTMRQRIEEIRTPYCIVVIPLLFETGQRDMVDRILVVDSTPEEQIRRTVLRDKVSEQDVQAIMDAQIDRKQRLEEADEVIENTGDLDSLYSQVDDIHRRYSDMAQTQLKQITLPDEQEMPSSAHTDELSSTKSAEKASVAVVESDYITYTLPLNERIRTLMRLENLFMETEYHLRGDDIFDSRAAMQGLIDIMTIFCRPELKTEFMKELERINAGLVRYAQIDGIDKERLETVLNQLKTYVRDLRAVEGQIALSLKLNEFLNGLRQKDSMPGGAMGFDTPAYGWWLGQPIEVRKKDLETWLSEFSLVKSVVKIILDLVRESAEPVEEIASNGFFQSSLDSSAPFQMIQVKVPVDSPYYPEISGGKHRFTVRFLKPMGSERPVQADTNVSFLLVRSAI